MMAREVYFLREVIFHDLNKKSSNFNIYFLSWRVKTKVKIILSKKSQVIYRIRMNVSQFAIRDAHWGNCDMKSLEKLKSRCELFYEKMNETHETNI